MFTKFSREGAIGKISLVALDICVAILLSGICIWMGEDILGGIGIVANQLLLQKTIVSNLFFNYFNPAVVPAINTFTSLWMFLISMLVFLSVVVLLHVFFKKKNSKKFKDRQVKYQSFCASVVSYENDELITNYTGKDFNYKKLHLSKRDFTKSDNRSALLKEIKAMHEIIKGNEKNKLRELYFGLGFVDELESKFNHHSWYKRVEAIQEAKQFGVIQLYPNIFKLVSDSHELVRRNALLARIDLDEQPLSFLEEIDYSLSIWERHKILSSLTKLPTIKLPNFSKLYTKHPLHKDFLKELSDYFNQKEQATVLQLA